MLIIIHKYLCMTLDSKLHCKEDVQIKQLELNIKLAKINWLFCKRSTLSNYNKLPIYKQILKPVWTYGMKLRGVLVFQTYRSTIPEQSFKNYHEMSIVHHKRRSSS